MIYIFVSVAATFCLYGCVYAIWLRDVRKKHEVSMARLAELGKIIKRGGHTFEELENLQREVDKA